MILVNNKMNICFANQRVKAVYLNFYGQEDLALSIVCPLQCPMSMSSQLVFNGQSWVLPDRHILTSSQYYKFFLEINLFKWFTIKFVSRFIFTGYQVTSTLITKLL